MHQEIVHPIHPADVPRSAPNERPSLLVKKMVDEEKFVRNKSRKGRWLRKFGQALSFMAVLGAHDAPEKMSGTVTERATPAEGVKNTRESTDSAAIPDTTRVRYKHQEYSRQEFQDMVLNAMTEYLGSMADACSTAEQCYYYYGNQLEIEPEIMHIATGRSAEELQWIGRAIRSGFVAQPGLRFAGSYVGVSEAGGDILPPLSKAERKRFYFVEFQRTLATDEHIFRQARVREHSPAEQVEIANLAGKVAATHTYLAARGKRNVFRAGIDPNFSRWFHEGTNEGDGMVSGDTKWSLAFQSAMRATNNLYDFLRTHLAPGQTVAEIDAQYDVARAGLKRHYHESRRELFLRLAEQYPEQWETSLKRESASLKQLPDSALLALNRDAE